MWRPLRQFAIDILLTPRFALAIRLFFLGRCELQIRVENAAFKQIARDALHGFTGARIHCCQRRFVHFGSTGSIAPLLNDGLRHGDKASNIGVDGDKGRTIGFADFALKHAQFEQLRLGDASARTDAGEFGDGIFKIKLRGDQRPKHFGALASQPLVQLCRSSGR